METEIIFPRFQTRGVLGGAYRERNPKSLLTHLADTVESKTCSRVKYDHLVDPYGMAGAALTNRPTCETCARKWDKLTAAQKSETETVAA